MDSETVSLIFGIVLGTIITFLSFVSFTYPTSDLVKHECGEYNRTTGDFQFINK